MLGGKRQGLIGRPKLNTQKKKNNDSWKKQMKPRGTENSSEIQGTSISSFTCGCGTERGSRGHGPPLPPPFHSGTRVPRSLAAFFGGQMSSLGPTRGLLLCCSLCAGVSGARAAWLLQGDSARTRGCWRGIAGGRAGCVGGRGNAAVAGRQAARHGDGDGTGHLRESATYRDCPCSRRAPGKRRRGGGRRQGGVCVKGERGGRERGRKSNSLAPGSEPFALIS